MYLAMILDTRIRTDFRLSSDRRKKEAPEEEEEEEKTHGFCRRTDPTPSLAQLYHIYYDTPAKIPRRIAVSCMHLLFRSTKRLDQDLIY